MWKLVLTRTPDPIRPTRRGPDPNRPTGRKIFSGGNFRGDVFRGYFRLFSDAIYTIWYKRWIENGDLRTRRRLNSASHSSTANRRCRFYRAILCIARTMLSHNVCPSVCHSVCLSHAGIVSKPLNISNFLHLRVASQVKLSSHIILVFPDPYQTLR